MKTTKTIVGILQDLIRTEKATLSELEQTKPRTAKVRAAIAEQQDRILKLNHAIVTRKVKHFLAPAVALKERADRNSQVAREKVAKKKTHKGKTLQEIRETELRIAADYQKAHLATPHLTENRWTTYHAHEYDLCPSRVREILRKYR